MSSTSLLKMNNERRMDSIPIIQLCKTFTLCRKDIIHTVHLRDLGPISQRDLSKDVNKA